jgi:hypothetical protein
MEALCDLSKHSKSFYCSSVAFVVFTEKVLKRLFPNVSNGQEKGTPQPPASETPSKDVTPEAVQQKDAHSLTGKDGLQVSLLLYT